MSKVNTQCAKGCVTKYHGPTDHKGSRVSAKNLTSGRKLTRPWDDALDSQENHACVAAELLETTELLSVSVDNGGWVFIAKVYFG